MGGAWYHGVAANRLNDRGLQKPDDTPNNPQTAIGAIPLEPQLHYWVVAERCQSRPDLPAAGGSVGPVALVVLLVLRFPRLGYRRAATAWTDLRGARGILRLPGMAVAAT